MTAALLFLKAYWRIVAILAVVGFFLYALNRALDKAEQTGYDRAQGEYSAALAKANAETAALEQRQRAQSQKAAQAWERDRNDLQSQVDRLVSITRPVRLCRPASSAPVPGASAATGRPDDRAGAPVDDVQASGNLAGAFVVYGGECERYRRQLAALQAWVKGLSK